MGHRYFTNSFQMSVADQDQNQYHMDAYQSYIHSGRAVDPVYGSYVHQMENALTSGVSSAFPRNLDCGTNEHSLSSFSMQRPCFQAAVPGPSHDPFSHLSAAGTFYRTQENNAAMLVLLTTTEALFMKLKNNWSFIKYSSHYYCPTTNLINHSSRVDLANLTANSTTYERSHTAVPPAGYGRFLNSETNGLSHETDRFVVGRSTVDISGYHHGSVSSRFPISLPQYLHGVVLAIPTWDMKQLTLKMVLQFPSETFSSRYPRPSAASGWRNSYRNERSRIASERYQSLSNAADTHAQMESEVPTYLTVFHSGHLFHFPKLSGQPYRGQKTLITVTFFRRYFPETFPATFSDTDHIIRSAKRRSATFLKAPEPKTITRLPCAVFLRQPESHAPRARACGPLLVPSFYHRLVRPSCTSKPLSVLSEPCFSIFLVFQPPTASDGSSLPWPRPVCALGRPLLHLSHFSPLFGSRHTRFFFHSCDPTPPLGLSSIQT
ncbi:hypothetical protein CK203_036608 [Vitis vinifera]|uniref:Uncharacterized protein n=1 Tax=Vitis vinifera TaxID=29760 RepID=A0A438HIQ3_VITVI|nr:hypothetical protein CK203_036608 [Vitis vinifera]